MRVVIREDPPSRDVLGLVADGWVRELEASATAALAPRALLGVADTVPPYVDEVHIGRGARETGNGGDPAPALTVVRRALVGAGAVSRLRSSAVGALERRDVRWAVDHGAALPEPLSERPLWEVTHLARFETTIARFGGYVDPLGGDVGDRITAWTARPESNAGAPERGWFLDDFLSRQRGLMETAGIATANRAEFLRWYVDAYKGMYTELAEQLWRWLNGQGALRKPTRGERVALGPVPDGTRVWDRDRLAHALPELRTPH